MKIWVWHLAPTLTTTEQVSVEVGTWHPSTREVKNGRSFCANWKGQRQWETVRKRGLCAWQGKLRNFQHLWLDAWHQVSPECQDVLRWESWRPTPSRGALRSGWWGCCGLSQFAYAPWVVPCTWRHLYLDSVVYKEGEGAAAAPELGRGMWRGRSLGGVGRVTE